MPEEKTVKAKQIQQRKAASGRINNDVGQITINGLTLCGYGALMHLWTYSVSISCDISQSTINTHYLVDIFHPNCPEVSTAQEIKALTLAVLPLPKLHTNTTLHHFLSQTLSPLLK